MIFYFIEQLYFCVDGEVSFFDFLVLFLGNYFLVLIFYLDVIGYREFGYLIPDTIFSKKYKAY